MPKFRESRYYQCVEPGLSLADVSSVNGVAGGADPTQVDAWNDCQEIRVWEKRKKVHFPSRNRDIAHYTNVSTSYGYKFFVKKHFHWLVPGNFACWWIPNHTDVSLPFSLRWKLRPWSRTTTVSTNSINVSKRSQTCPISRNECNRNWRNSAGSGRRCLKRSVSNELRS